MHVALRSEKLRSRFMSSADGDGDAARLKRENLRGVLECTDSFCLTKHWLAESTLDRIYAPRRAVRSA